MIPLTKMPVVIIGPGRYETRNGHSVAIHEIHGPGTFAAKGTIRLPGKQRERLEFNIWHVSGRFMPIGEHQWDVIRKVEG